MAYDTPHGPSEASARYRRAGQKKATGAWRAPGGWRIAPCIQGNHPISKPRQRVSDQPGSSAGSADDGAADSESSAGAAGAGLPLTSSRGRV